MKHNELLKKLECSRALKSHKIDCEKGTVTVTYNASTISNETTTSIYKLVLSEEIKKLMAITGETKLDRCYGIDIVDIDDETVKILPKYNANIGGFVSWKAHNNYYLLYNNNIIISDKHISGNCIYGCANYVRKAFGIYKGYLIAEYDEYICLIDTKGNVVKMKYIPEPESGREDHLRINIYDNKLMVSVYCYYDNDWHHGGWEDDECDLDESILEIPKVIMLKVFNEYFQKNKIDTWDGDYRCSLREFYKVNDKTLPTNKIKIAVDYRKEKRARYSKDISYDTIYIVSELKENGISFEIVEENKLSLCKFVRENEEQIKEKLNELVAKYI